jgi:hypothetical protein
MERGVARIAILEPAVEVRLLFARHVSRLGHEAVLPEGPVPEDVDLVIVEPVSAGDVDRTLAALRARPELLVICASITPQAPGAAKLSPHTYLVKPFALDTLGLAIAGALEGRPPG